MGLPVCFKNGGDKASFISGRGVATWSDKFINELFDKGDVFISSDCLENLIDRGFADRIGVTCREWTGKPISREIYKGINVRKQIKQKELIPISDKVYADSMSYHCELDGSLTPLFPAVTVYPRENGKKTVVFAGSPDVPWTYSTAFAMLCETRKEQFIDLLKSSDALPVYYPDDACVFLTAGYIGNDKMIVVPFNMGWDVLEDFPIWCKHDIKKIEKIEKDATYTEVEFTKTDNNNYSIKNPLGAMLPEVYILHI